eukprot:2570113-Pleurochrysis_carterae.AAC.1
METEKFAKVLRNDQHQLGHDPCAWLRLLTPFAAHLPLTAVVELFMRLAPLLLSPQIETKPVRLEVAGHLPTLSGRQFA